MPSPRLAPRSHDQRCGEPRLEARPSAACAGWARYASRPARSSNSMIARKGKSAAAPESYRGPSISRRPDPEPAHRRESSVPRLEAGDQSRGVGRLTGSACGLEQDHVGIISGGYFRVLRPGPSASRGPEVREATPAARVAAKGLALLSSRTGRRRPGARRARASPARGRRTIAPGTRRVRPMGPGFRVGEAAAADGGAGDGRGGVRRVARSAERPCGSPSRGRSAGRGRPSSGLRQPFPSGGRPRESSRSDDWTPGLGPRANRILESRPLRLLRVLVFLPRILVVAARPPGRPGAASRGPLVRGARAALRPASSRAVRAGTIEHAPPGACAAAAPASAADPRLRGRETPSARSPITMVQ